MTKSSKKTRLGRVVAVAAVLLGLGGLALLGWRWQASVMCEAIEVAGARHADVAALVALAGVDTGAVLYDIDPALVEDRLRRHPWVETASASRLPTGTLKLSVRERTPVALVMSSSGTPSHYLDASGYQMPLAPDAAYDVPLLYGLKAPYRPVQPVEDAAVRALLHALATADASALALVSELELQASGEVLLRTAPGPTGSIPVRLGQDGFDEKLQRLGAFWHQAVLAQPRAAFTVIDLRFDSQIVTRERAGR